MTCMSLMASAARALTMTAVSWGCAMAARMLTISTTTRSSIRVTPLRSFIAHSSMHSIIVQAPAPGGVDDITPLTIALASARRSATWLGGCVVHDDVPCPAAQLKNVVG